MSSRARTSDVVLPRGFSSLLDAVAWEDGLERAQSAIDSLWLQKAIYGLAHGLAQPGARRARVFQRFGAGLEIAVHVEWMGQERELGALLTGLFKDDFEAIGALGEAARMEALREIFAKVEAWTAERPSCLGGAARAGAQMERSGIELVAGMGWQDIALALGASEAAIAMEKAQLAKETRSGSASGESRRV